MIFSNKFPAAHVFHLSDSKNIKVGEDGLATLRPFPSTHHYVRNRSCDEPKLSRLCVSDSIIGCLTAVTWFDKSNTVSVFKSVDKLKTHKPYRVIDAAITGERWICKPAEFKLIYTFQPAKYIKFLHSVLPENVCIYELVDFLGANDEYTIEQQRIFFATLLKNQTRLFEIFEKVA